MSKPRVQSPVARPWETGPDREHNNRTPNEPLSGSKKVKNRNHTRHNNGEG
ncbi:small acid-soluble spore protein P [Cohnella sp. CFH 77786]|uniref:small acid-soluble spore protein P n=1 Tax=Cohnella sp. CFH 77786 TaxID=2662265 RepID=UPI001C6092CD|nr:small acid-soluble spore protein P [Cohnella sp. CFH 77786]